MKSVAELMRVIDPERVGIAGAIRRMAITLTAKALWQLTGYVIDGKTEVIAAEPFTGIGIAARPPATGKPEAIVVMVGDAKNPMVIAVRDEKTRAAIAGALKADEAMLFNSLACVYVKANGTIEARSPGGTAVALATLADVQAMRTAFNVHIHPASSGTTSATATQMAAPIGTTVLKGQ